MSDTVKAQWNLTRLAFAPITFDTDGKTVASFGTPWEHRGVRTLNITNNPNDSNRIAADGGLYYGGAGITTKQGDLEVVRFLDQFKKEILGYIEEWDGLGEGEGATSPFAMLYEISSDQGGIRAVWYNCTAGPINVSHTTNDVDDNRTYGTETSTITGKIVTLPNSQRRSAWSCKSGSSHYDDFFSSVQYPSDETTTTTTTGE